MKNEIIEKRLSLLRQEMKQKGIDFYLIPTADYHHSEYVDGFFKTREYFSGFTGSAGTLIVSEDDAGLWTDGRYFIQAEKELNGTGIRLFRMFEEGVPTMAEYLSAQMKEGQTLGFDGMVMPAGLGERFGKNLASKKITINYEWDLAESIWVERPKLACHPVKVLSDEINGKSFADKTEEIRKVMREKHCKYHFLAKLDDIMWLFNIRGEDVKCNPVALTYSLITDEEVHLFIQKEELTEEAGKYLDECNVTVHGYSDIIPFLKEYSFEGKILFDKGNISFSMYKILSEKAEYVSDSNPSELLKAVKNEVELANLRDIYIKDSAVLTKFIYWIKKNVGVIPLNEYTAAMHLDQMRSELPEFLDLSFDTISGYNENAAMMHYEATEQDNKTLEKEGMLLVDSGGQYMGGTTDVTRTFALGETTDKMKEHFTLVAMGMLRLAGAKFLQGCSGRNLDILARLPLWEKGIDYKCGTGHGIGYILNVHEGPHSIRSRFSDDVKEAVLVPGMIVSDEPGVYLEGEYGIRTENILEIVEEEKNSDGRFLGFRMLTYVPIDLELIDKSIMQPRDIELLNEYHKNVYEKLAPFMNAEELEWLKIATNAL